MIDTAVSMPSVETARPADSTQRLHALVNKHFDFVWRSVRRLGVRDGDADDAAQKVFLVVAQKLALIEPGSEQAFLFSTAMRVASHVRRDYRLAREAGANDFDQLTDSRPLADELTDRYRARKLVDSVLEDMPMELRAALVLYEVEEMTTPEVAATLGIPLGTAASRLRRAREEFEKRVQRAVRRGRAREQADG
jgi:RNA polymerase sigma-70 factor, ECF subfamily